jgi:hypothetical protein
MCPVRSVTYVSGRSQSFTFPENLNYVPKRSNNLGEWLPEFASQLLARRTSFA